MAVFRLVDNHMPSRLQTDLITNLDCLQTETVTPVPVHPLFFKLHLALPAYQVYSLVAPLCAMCL